MVNKTAIFSIPAVFLLTTVFTGCSARNPLSDAYHDWEIDSTPWDVKYDYDYLSPDGWGDGWPETIPDYTTEFDLTDQPYIPDIPETDGGLPVKSCETIVIYHPENTSDTISIAGEFNGWNPSVDILQDPDGDGTLEISLNLEPGEYAYKFVKNGSEWFLDPENPWTKYFCSGGSCELNSNLRVDDCNKPSLVMINFTAAEDGTITGSIQFVDGNEATGADTSSVKVFRNETEAEFNYDESSGLISFRWSSLPTDKYTIKVTASSNSGRAADPLYLIGWIEPEKFQWSDALIYFAFTDRFFDGDPSNNNPIGVEFQADYQGGDFEGIKQKIEEGYFDQMGVNVLWISPPYENPQSQGIGHDGHYYSGYHGYWPSEPTSAERNFGGDETLIELINTAHSHGIRVIMDAVLNHLHIEHPYWSDHRADGWFHGNGDCICGTGSCDWDSHRIDCWFTSYLPDIDYTNHNALTTMVDDTLNWVLNAGFDGMRVDAVKHFEHIVGQRLALELAEKYEIGGIRFYMVGETFTGGYGGSCGGGPDFIMQYINPIELDGQFDFPLFWVLLDVFAKQSADFNWLDTAVRGLERCYGSYPIMSPFLGNHDVARFISVANGDDISNPWNNPPPPPATSEPYHRLKLAFTFLLTYTGAPLIYYGDEIGMPGATDPDNRRMMKFSGLTSNERMVLDRVKLVGTARKNYIALRRGVRTTLYVDSNFYVYARGTGNDTVIVALNRNNFDVTSPSIAIPSELSIPDETRFTDLISGSSFTVSSGSITVNLAAKDGAVFVQR